MKRIPVECLCRMFSSRKYWPEHNPKLAVPDWEKIYVEIFHRHLDSDGESEMGKTWKALHHAEEEALKILAGRNAARSPLSPQTNPVGRDL